MRKLLRILVLVSIFSALPPYAISQEIIYLTNTEWPPLSSEKLEYYGFITKMVTDAFAIEGIEVKYKFLPSKRAFGFAKNNSTWMGSVGWTKTPEREKDWFYSNSLYSGKGVFWHHRDLKFDWEQFEDLYKFTFGGTIGHTYYEMDKLIKEGKIKVQLVSEEKQNFGKLLLKRIDLFPVSLFVGQYVLNKNFTPEERKLITYHPKPYVTASLHVVFSKTHKESKRVLEIFNRGLNKLKDSGKFVQIIQAQHLGEYDEKN